jgi:hypothetical protein
MRAIGAFWRGELRLAQAFWTWGIMGGALVNLSTTLVAVTLLLADLPAWLAALAFAIPIPWNVALVVGVWRSAARDPAASRGFAELARIAIVAWAAALCVV